MRAPWHALHASLSRATETLSFQRRFTTIRHAAPELCRFADPPGLFDFLHGPDGDPVARNAVLAGLVDAAQGEGNDSDAAVTLLLLALWPGLDAVHHRLSRHFHAEPGALAGEISARASLGIRSLDRGRVTWIAATVIRNVERDIRRLLRAGWREAARRDPLPEEMGGALVGAPSALGLPDDLEPATAVRLLEARLRPVIGADATLVVAIAVLDERQHEAAGRLGLSPEVARKRYQRALRRLRPVFDDMP